MSIQLPADVNTTPADESFYLGFSRQDLKFHQALGELIDNSISASQNVRRFDIEIHIQKKGEDIELLVADSGAGIPFNDIQGHILRFGGRGSRQGPLNEHGFGLKNALCVLTQNRLPFYILTRDKEASDQGLYLKVIGPFRHDMQLISGTEAEWAGDLVNCTADIGTRVYAKTTMHYFRTLYHRNSSFETLILRLLEHLGVMYRGYLEGAKSEILLRWRDISAGNTAWTHRSVDPIPVPYVRATEEHLTINYEGQSHDVYYKWGIRDPAQVEDPSKGAPYPLKIYYQGNIQTQGIDIRVRGRVILPHQITYLWPDRVPHNDLNNLLGELIIEDRAFSTVNNKIELDPNNPVWQAVTDLLQEDKYQPSTVIAGARQTEAEIRKGLANKVMNIVPGSHVQQNVSTWPAVGVMIDIVQTNPDGTTMIYELKAGSTKPLDVYQLVMYWDARVEEGTRPKLGRLVANEKNEKVDVLIKYWNERKDKGGERYNFEFKLVGDLV